MNNYKKSSKRMMLYILVLVFTLITYISFKGSRVYSYAELSEIKNTRIADSNLLGGIEVNGIYSPYNSLTNTYYFSSNSLDNLKIIVHGIGDNDQSISCDTNRLECTIVVFNDTRYFETTLKVINIPLVSITTGMVSDGNFTVERDDEELIHFQVIDNNYINNGMKSELYSGTATMRIRGGYTKIYPKKGYKIVLEKMLLCWACEMMTIGLSMRFIMISQ